MGVDIELKHEKYMENKLGVRREDQSLYYQLPIGNYTELMMFRRGISLAMELLTRDFEKLETDDGILAKEELDALNLLSRLQLSLTCYDLDMADVIDNKCSEETVT